MDDKTLSEILNFSEEDFPSEAEGEALIKFFRFYTETMLILSGESHLRLNNLAAFLKNTEKIEVKEDINVKVINLTYNQIMRSIRGMDTILIVAPERTDELLNVRRRIRKLPKKSCFFFTYEEIDKALENPDTDGQNIFCRLNLNI